MAQTLERAVTNRPGWVRALAGAVAVLVAIQKPLSWLPGHTDAWWLDPVVFLLPVLLFVPLLPLVSYRRRDWILMVFVPFWNIVVAAKVGWRLANLPARDWPPRPDEPGCLQWQAGRAQPRQ